MADASLFRTPQNTQNKNNIHLTSNIKTFRKQFESTSTTYLCTKLLIPSCYISVVNADTLKSKKRGNVRKRNMGGRSPNHCCHGKTLIITYSECVFVALVIQHAQRMGRIILPPVACPVLQHFDTLSHKRHDFRGKKLLSVKCFLIFSKTSV